MEKMIYMTPETSVSLIETEMILADSIDSDKEQGKGDPGPGARGVWDVEEEEE